VLNRRGERSKHIIDRDWSHQIALPAHRGTGGNYVTIRLFCQGLSLSDRSHSFRRDDVDMAVFCFAVREHAEQFQERFGDEFIDLRTDQSSRDRAGSRVKENVSIETACRILHRSLVARRRFVATCCLHATCELTSVWGVAGSSSGVRLYCVLCVTESPLLS